MPRVCINVVNDSCGPCSLKALGHCRTVQTDMDSAQIASKIITAHMESAGCVWRILERYKLDNPAGPA